MSTDKYALLGSTNSPFVHKVILVALELGLRDRVVDQDESTLLEIMDRAELAINAR